MKHDDTQQLRYRFYGYFSAFVACIYGHRTGVLTNMTVDEVSEHKTNRDFGAAQIYFEPEEFNWLETWLEIREKCDPPNNLVFFTAGKGPAKNMVRYMQGAWAEMGLPGRPSFIDIRTAVSAHAKNVHAAKVRSRMATFMCHNTSTADKFYALNLDTQQSYEMRRLFEGVTSSSTTTASPSAAATTSAAASTSAASSSSTPRSRKRKRTPPSDNKQEHEEEEEEEEGAHSQATESTPEKHCSAYKQYAKVMVKLSPLGEKLKAAQRATTRAKREALRELKRSSTPEKEPKSPTEED
ncbi:uncharacterized protein LOC122872093 isoform X2 [Siniperca chuatsi]|uniref:uncharacterized protein LOC122872093 isoform X2 n=1 Tax=Siniperca chuatsi TaxID=119488 RepID=UPI001CE087C4|nr:uncharacterized protein LOC122872093 isoform X2 [Siniperca chuatsi]